MSDLDPNIRGMCTECKTEHTTQWMARNVFAQSGTMPSCKYCGGTVAVIDARQGIDRIRNQMDQERGL